MPGDPRGNFWGLWLSDEAEQHGGVNASGSSGSLPDGSKIDMLKTGPAKPETTQIPIVSYAQEHQEGLTVGIRHVCRRRLDTLIRSICSSLPHAHVKIGSLHIAIYGFHQTLSRHRAS